VPIRVCPGAGGYHTPAAICDHSKPETKTFPIKPRYKRQLSTPKGAKTWVFWESCETLSAEKLDTYVLGGIAKVFP
jgi:hypothetical protein